MRHNAIDLFCGGGGMTEGAERSGARVQVAANHMPLPCEWFAKNHPTTRVIQQDLLQLDMRQLDIDLRDGTVLACPSCKDFSPAGQPSKKGRGGSHAPDAAKIARRRTQDRNTPEAVLDAARALEPRAIVVENSDYFPKVFPAFGPWLAYLEALGYNVAWRIVNALEFGGCTDRPRFVLTASREKLCEIPQGTSAPGTIAQCLDPDDHPKNRWQPLGKDSRRMRELVDKACSDAGARCFVNNVGDGVRGRPLSDPFPSLTTQSGTQFILIDADNARRRVLNTSELKRAMGFPEHYQFPGNKKTAGLLLGDAFHVACAREAYKAVA